MPSSDDSWFLLSPKTGARTAIPLTQIGERGCEVVCEKGADLVALLTSLINLTALAKNCISLRASAFDYQGAGVLLAGWMNSGVAESLLSFASRGGRYVGCDRILLKDAGKRMCGLPGPLRLDARYLKYFSQVRKNISLRKRIQLKSIALLVASQKWLSYEVVNRLFPVRLCWTPCLSYRVNSKLSWNHEPYFPRR